MSWDTLANLLDPDELAQVQRTYAEPPRSACAATWLAARGLLVVVVKVDDALAGWLLTPAADRAEAMCMAEGLAAAAAANFERTRASLAAAAAALRRAAH